MNQPIEKTGIVIFDLDGCVSNDLWRRNLLPSGDPSHDQSLYDAYHANAINDHVLIPGANRVHEANEAGLLIAFCTARPVSIYHETIDWIRQHLHLQHRVDFVLAMRPVADTRGAVEIKQDMLEAVLKFAIDNGTNVHAAFDDRADVITMYRNNGIPAWVLDEKGTDAPPLTKHSGESEPSDFLRQFQPQPTSTEDWVTGDSTDMPSEYPEVIQPVAPLEIDAGDILLNMGATFKERNALYKDNAVLVGEIMAAMFPNGVKLNSAADFHLWHLFELKIVKLTRFVKSGLTHVDSIHDDAIYSAMCERLVTNHTIEVL